MSETVTLKKEDLLKAHQEGCNATKKALENLYPEVFRPKLALENDHILIRAEGAFKGEAFFVSRHDQMVRLTNLVTPGTWSGWRTQEFYSFPHEADFRLMTSGTIALTIKDGKIAGAVVKED